MNPKWNGVWKSRIVPYIKPQSLIPGPGESPAIATSC